MYLPIHMKSCLIALIFSSLVTMTLKAMLTLAVSQDDRDLDCRVAAWCLSAQDNGLIWLVLSEKLHVTSTGIMGSNVTVSLSGQYCDSI